MLEAAWRPPGWASKPTGSPRFLISKDGIDVGQLTLSDRAILFGRKVPNEPERGTVRLDHDSISRQHAAVVHSFTGETFVIDLGSRFGTTVDGEKLIPQKYTPIKDGAVVVFGASTRAYAFAVRPPKDGAAAGVRGVAIPPPAAATSAGAAGSTAGARPRPPPPPGTLGDDEVDPMANYVDEEGAEKAAGAGEAGGGAGEAGEEARRREKQRRKELKAELKAAAKAERKAERKAEKKAVKKARKREEGREDGAERKGQTGGDGQPGADGSGSDGRVRGEELLRAEEEDGGSSHSRSRTD